MSSGEPGTAPIHLSVGVQALPQFPLLVPVPVLPPGSSAIISTVSLSHGRWGQLQAIGEGRAEAALCSGHGSHTPSRLSWS